MKKERKNLNNRNQRMITYGFMIKYNGKRLNVQSLPSTSHFFVNYSLYFWIFRKINRNWLTRKSIGKVLESGLILNDDRLRRLNNSNFMFTSVYLFTRSLQDLPQTQDHVQKGCDVFDVRSRFPFICFHLLGRREWKQMTIRWLNLLSIRVSIHEILRFGSMRKIIKEP